MKEDVQKKIESISERLSANKLSSCEPVSMCCRETAATRLERLIAERERELHGLRELHALAKGLQNGAPAEELLWSLIGGIRGYNP